MKEQLGKDKNVGKVTIPSLYSIDNYLNFLDYISFICRKKGWERLGTLLYPSYIIFVVLPAILLLGDQIGDQIFKVIFLKFESGLLFLLILNLILGFMCYIVSRTFFKGRWKKFREQRKNNLL
ncbi:MAG: hypothetical protein R6V04_16630 [bacterium]